jgi:hypothetical protein
VEELGQTLKQSTITFQLVNPSEPVNTMGQNHNGSSDREIKSE